MQLRRPFGLENKGCPLNISSKQPFVCLIGTKISVSLSLALNLRFAEDEDQSTSISSNIACVHQSWAMHTHQNSSVYHNQQISTKTKDLQPNAEDQVTSAAQIPYVQHVHAYLSNVPIL